MTKNEEVNEELVLASVNETLNTNYERLEDVPTDKLKRTCMLLSIAQLLIEHPDMRVFMCHPKEDF